MPFPSIVLATASLLVLVFGTLAWRLTSSRPLVVNIVLSSALLLVGAYAASSKERPEFAYILPFFAAMLCGGRAIGLMLRSQKETDLRAPGLLMTGVTVAALAGAICAYVYR